MSLSWQIVNEFWLFGLDQRFFHSTQVLTWLTPDQLQQVLVGFMMERYRNDVLILIFCQQVALTQVISDDVTPQFLRQEVHVVVKFLEASTVLTLQVI